MAESEIPFAQDVLTCTYCETVATDYCKSCADNLCLTCKSFHLKSNVPDGHHIVPIVQKRKDVVADVMCQYHPSKKYEACCEDCEAPVCAQCIIEDHSSHKMIEKSHMCDKIKNIMSKVLQNIKISEQQKNLKQVKSEKHSIKVSYTHTRNEMKKKADRVKSRIDNILEEMINESIDHENRAITELSSYEGMLNDFLLEISGEEIYQQKIQSSNPNDLILLYKTICDFVTSVESNLTLKVRPPVFLESKLEENIDLFGSLYQSMITHVTDHEEVKSDMCDDFRSDIDVGILLVTKDQIKIDETQKELIHDLYVISKGTCLHGNGKNESATVKYLKTKHNADREEKKLLHEASVLTKLKYKNIIHLLGFCQEHPWMVVMELAQEGTLGEYLRKYKDSKQSYVACLMLQVAEGMVYLSKKRIVHRHLAVCSILLVDQRTAKICNFEMSREISEDDTYYEAKHGEKFLVRWTPPESTFFARYDSKSDVWSFGITLWEASSYGQRPYGKMKAQEIMQFLVQENKRLERPAKCSNEMYELMLDCWQYDPDNRPTFIQIHQRMECIYNLLREENE